MRHGSLHQKAFLFQRKKEIHDAMQQATYNVRIRCLREADQLLRLSGRLSCQSYLSLLKLQNDPPRHAFYNTPNIYCNNIQCISAQIVVGTYKSRFQNNKRHPVIKYSSDNKCTDNQRTEGKHTESTLG